MDCNNFISSIEYIGDSGCDRFDIIIIDMHGYYREGRIFQNIQDLSMDIVSTLENDSYLLNTYLFLEHDFGMWSLSDEVGRVLSRISDRLNILVVHVLFNRGVVDINRASSSYGEGVRPVVDRTEKWVVDMLESVHERTQSCIDRLLHTKLKPEGFLFLPHSMNKYEPDTLVIPRYGELEEYINSWSYETSGLRQNTLLSKTDNNVGIGNLDAYLHIERVFKENGEPVVWNRSYRTNPSYYDFGLMNRYTNSAFIEIRKDNLSLSEKEMMMNNMHYLLCPVKLQKYANMLAEGIERHYAGGQNNQG